ncbi:FAD-dependent oxidoreductase [Segetibacter aerophilus]|uniref:(2Fe-2S)-binding protein n=1 Tax=Segetibacter aerophilus TaxID=670293 RepID=A0A512BIW9_9BACT|nr:FAD-dependent oxidoreductase [Segetibacter aerophilus]GEO11914.1 (2Fe-2S)-binding protein [Segetibacter aerophilus]
MSSISIWKDKAEETSFSPLRTDITVDVAIVGGGITGLTAAYILSKAGKKVAVLEARKIGEGATGSSTGNLYCTIGSPGLHNVKSKFDEQKIKEVVESRAAAVDFIETVITELNIQCDFKRVPWTLFTEGEAGKSFVEKEMQAAEDAGLTVSKSFAIPLKIETGFTVKKQAQFNPLEYVKALSKKIVSGNCSVYELTKVDDVTEGETCTVKTAGGTVTASQVIMATHSPKGIYAVHMNMGPYREYAVGVTLNGSYPADGVWWDWDGVKQEHYSMRTYDTSKGKILMVLGEMHKVGQKEDNHECYDNLEKFLRERYDVRSVEFRWSAQQFKAADGIPYIGLSSGNSKTYIATGFSADGLTYGTLASMIISDEILGKQNKWAKTYDASRVTPLASAKQFIKENVNVAFEFVKDRFTKNEADEFAEVAVGQGKVMEVDGKKCGVHRDASGKLHVVSAICTHMGCINHWNEVEQSWDCPCHGSRFSIDGEVLEGPAYTALKKVMV